MIHFTYTSRKNGIRTLLVTPKDKDTITQKSRVIYRHEHGRVKCDEDYIGESARTIRENFKEHLTSFSLFMNILISQAITLVWTISA